MDITQEVGENPQLMSLRLRHWAKVRLLLTFPHGFLRRTLIYGYIVSAYLSNELVDQFRGKLPETPTFDGKRPWFPVDFPSHQSNESLTYLQQSVSNWKGASCVFTNRGLGILYTATGRKIRCPGWSKPMEYRIAGMNIHLHPFIIHLHISASLVWTEGQQGFDPHSDIYKIGSANGIADWLARNCCSQAPTPSAPEDRHSAALLADLHCFG